jgi:hypothetical protein
MNVEIFLTYLEQCLVPTLLLGEIVIMDNLPAHTVAGVREAIEATGAMLRHLPPYSPDLNPSSSPSPNSRLICARPPSAQSPPFGIESEQSSTPLPQKSATTTSDTPGMGQTNGNPL